MKKVQQENYKNAIASLKTLITCCIRKPSAQKFSRPCAHRELLVPASVFLAYADIQCHPEFGTSSRAIMLFGCTSISTTIGFQYVGWPSGVKTSLTLKAE